MVRHAKSTEEKNAEYMRRKLALEREATQLYLLELEKKLQKKKHISARKICEKVTKDYKQKTGISISLTHTTIIRHARGDVTRAQTGGSNSWLSPEEAKQVVDYIIETGNQGFPLSHKRLKEHVDEICAVKWGDKFPEKGVGKKWTHRFVVKHSEQIMTSWSTNLDEKRGRALNPHTKEAWDKLLEETVTSHHITDADQVYAVDETGVTGQTGVKERVIGQRKKGLHYQQTGSSRENTTVFVTICADGTALAPAVIFKGKAYNPRWADFNPAKAL
jgi:hypothetical protein